MSSFYFSKLCSGIMHDLLNASLTDKSQINIITIGSIRVKMSKCLGASFSEHILVTYKTKKRLSMKIFLTSNGVETCYKQYIELFIRQSKFKSLMSTLLSSPGTCSKLLLVLKGGILKNNRELMSTIFNKKISYVSYDSTHKNTDTQF